METNNKRIAKNTLLLYFRTLLTMGVSLFTVRVVLDVLGVVDYGLYNVVGGVVVMFGFLSSSMASASQRFFSYELGKKNYIQLGKIFSLTVLIYLFLAVLILILAETVGLWFLNNKMNIPEDRREAAQWVYQFSVMSFLGTMLTVPYNAIIIARERMNVYAYVSIVEVILKLVIVYALVIFSFDKLTLYSVLTFAVTLIITLIYRVYCRRNFNECKFAFFWDRELFNKLLSFSGWNLFGALANILNSQGINILLNIFFGPVVNASRAISYRINSAVNQFVLNFMTASRPQITKSYATGEKIQMLNLVFQTSKFSYFLLLVISLPFLLEPHFILSMWLKEAPPYTVLFTKLSFVAAMIDSLSYSLQSAAQATGKIKLYQVAVGSLMLSSLPISYILYREGWPPEAVFYVLIVISIVSLFVRLYLLYLAIGLDIIKYVQRVILPSLVITILTYSFTLFAQKLLVYGLTRFFIVSLLGLISTIFCVYSFGVSKNEKAFIFQTLKKIKR